MLWSAYLQATVVMQTSVYNCWNCGCHLEQRFQSSVWICLRYQECPEWLLLRWLQPIVEFRLQWQQCCFYHGWLCWYWHSDYCLSILIARAQHLPSVLHCRVWIRQWVCHTVEQHDALSPISILCRYLSKASWSIEPVSKTFSGQTQ